MVFKKNVSPFTERLKSLYRKGIRGVNGLHLAFTQPSRSIACSANGHHSAENAHRFSENAHRFSKSAHRFPASEHPLTAKEYALLAIETLLTSEEVLPTYDASVFSQKMHFSPFCEGYVKGRLSTFTPAHPLSTRVPQPLGEGESKFLKSPVRARARAHKICARARAHKINHTEPIITHDMMNDMTRYDEIMGGKPARTRQNAGTVPTSCRNRSAKPSATSKLLSTLLLLLLMVLGGANEAWGQFLGYIFGLDHVQRVCAKIDRLKPVQNNTHRFDLRQGHGGNSQCKDRQLFDTNQIIPQGINKR